MNPEDLSYESAAICAVGPSLPALPPDPIVMADATVFNATYTGDAYYDKSSGFIVAYDYKEVDSNGQGDGFTCSNTLIFVSIADH